MKELIFELTVDDVKSSMKTDDTLPMVGEFDHEGDTVKLKMTATAGDKLLLEELFGGYHQVVTFQKIENKQTELPYADDDRFEI